MSNNYKIKYLKYKLKYLDLKKVNIKLQQGGFSYNIDKKYYYEGFSNWLNKYYEKFIPYIFKENKVIIEKTQYVRNIATLYDILQLKKYYNNISDIIIKQVINNLNYYLKEFKNNKNNMRQSSAFLLLALHELDKKEYKEDISKITEFLYKELPKMERKFELGEVLMALTLTLDDNNNKEILLNKQKEMYEEINITENNNDDIFQYNWHSKFLYSLFKKNIINEYVKKHAKLLKEKILEILPNIKKLYDETNYLAVSFEALSSISQILKNNYDLNKEINELFQMLKEREKNGLFVFKNNEARLDITGHVLNGLFIYNPNI